ncbi:ABC-2 family transporter protein [Candidatus Woesebacteria bacterium]|nr:ABC-2 family transporter protein [Candidatus Woesebacteria bacterium]
MNLSESKEALSIRWRIIKANTKYSISESLAYTGNNWGSLASTIIFMITFLIFISAIYGNVKSIAGYSYSEMLIFVLVAQINFYLTWGFSIPNVVKLGEGVKTGELDLYLTKPIPHLWFVTFRKIDLVLLFSNATPSLIPLVYLLIKNFDLHITLYNILSGIAIIILGQIFLHCFQFILLLGAFWAGEARGFELLMYQLGNYNEPIPFEGYPVNLRYLGFILLPVILHTALSTSFLLGKTTSIELFLLGVGATILALIAKNFVWRLALRQYSSASS